VALVLALTGSALALPGRNSVDAGDIKKNAVRAKHIKKNAVRAAEIKSGAVGADEIADGSVGAAEIAEGSVTEVATDLVRYGRETAEVQTTAETEIGPAVTVEAREGDVISYVANVVARRLAGAGDCVLRFGVETPDSSGSAIIGTTGSAVDTQIWSTHDPQSHAITPLRAEARQYPVLVPGTYRFTILSNPDVGTTCAHTNRALWVTVDR